VNRCVSQTRVHGHGRRVVGLDANVQFLLVVLVIIIFTTTLYRLFHGKAFAGSNESAGHTHPSMVGVHAQIRQVGARVVRVRRGSVGRAGVDIDKTNNCVTFRRCAGGGCSHEHLVFGPRVAKGKALLDAIEFAEAVELAPGILDRAVVEGAHDNIRARTEFGVLAIADADVRWQ